MRLIVWTSLVLVCWWAVDAHAAAESQSKTKKNKYAASTNDASDEERWQASHEDPSGCRGKKCQQSKARINDVKPKWKSNNKDQSIEMESKTKYNKNRKAVVVEPPSEEEFDVSDLEDDDATTESEEGVSATEEDEESEEVVPKKRQTTYVKKFAHEKNAKKWKPDSDELRILKLHRGNIDPQNKKGRKKKFRAYEESDEDSDNQFPRRVQLHDEEEL